VIGVGEVGAPGRHLARRAAQGDRPAGAEVQRLQQRGRGAGQRRRRGQVAQAGRRAAPAQRATIRRSMASGALDSMSCSQIAQRQRLEGLGAADRRAGAGGRAPRAR
jgi:hypothetical protein